METFSDNWYISKYPEVKLSIENGEYKTPYHHYVSVGKDLGLKPLPPVPGNFCEKTYLKKHQDVRHRVESGEFTSSFHYYITEGFTDDLRSDDNGRFKITTKGVMTCLRTILKNMKLT